MAKELNIAPKVKGGMQGMGPKADVDLTKVAEVFGKMVSFRDALKLYHWHTTGKASYARHIAIDQIIDTINDVADRMVETTYGMYGNIDIAIPMTARPTDVSAFAQQMFDYMENARQYFPCSFHQAIIDDYTEAIQQMRFRTTRLE